MPKKLRELSFEERDRLQRPDRLLYDMRIKRQWAHRKGRRIEHYIDVCWWGSVALAGIATLAGFVAPIPEVEAIVQIKPWMISLLTAIAAGLEITRQRASWREKSNAYYGHRDVLRSLIGRAEYQIPLLADDAVAQLSLEFDREEMRLGRDLQAINTMRDDTKGPEKAEGSRQGEA